MKVRIIKEVADDTWVPEELPDKNTMRSARHQTRKTPVKVSADPEIQAKKLKRHGDIDRKIAKAAELEASGTDFVKKMLNAIQKDPTAVDRIQDAIQTRELRQDVGQALLAIAKGEEAPSWVQPGGAWEKTTVGFLQQYVYILGIEYALIFHYRWGQNRAWVGIEDFLDAWFGRYLLNPVSNNPKAFAKRHKADMEKAQKQGFIKDFDPENILYALRENKRTIKCKIRRNK